MCVCCKFSVDGFFKKKREKAAHDDDERKKERGKRAAIDIEELLHAAAPELFDAVQPFARAGD